MRTAPAVVLYLCLGAAQAAAQSQSECRFLCAPQLLIEPTLTVENLVKAPRVRTPGGEEERGGRETVFEIILAVDIPTRLPRLGFTAEAIFVPFAKGSSNPFTGRSVQEVGVSAIRDNAVELEFEANFVVVKSEQTKGWVSSHFDIVDKFSPAERPSDSAVYTHKLNFEWDTAFALFNKLPDGHWLRDVEIEGSLDYVATGLPKAGDRIDGDTFMTPASPWSFSLVVVIPVTR